MQQLKGPTHHGLKKRGNVIAHQRLDTSPYANVPVGVLPARHDNVVARDAQGALQYRAALFLVALLHEDDVLDLRGWNVIREFHRCTTGSICWESRGVGEEGSEDSYVIR